MPPPVEPKSPPPHNATQTLHEISTLLSLLLVTCLSPKPFFFGRFKSLHPLLTSLQSTLSDISDSFPLWTENPLLSSTLLPDLLSALRRLDSLSNSCSSPDLPAGTGKLLLQSDLNIATASLSEVLHHLQLLLRSGVLLRHHQSSTAIVLSQPAPGSASKEDLSFYIRDLFTRLQIGGSEFKEKALESLVQLLIEEDKAPILVVKEGNIRYLIHLLDHGSHHHHIQHQSAVRDLAVSAVCALAAAGEQPRKALFEEGGLGPLLRVLETGSPLTREKSVSAIESLTADPENVWAVSAYGGVSPLIDACRCGTPRTQAHAAGAIRNAAAVEDVRSALLEENAIPALIQLLVSSSVVVQEKAAGCISALASSGDDILLAAIIQERGLRNLVQLVMDSADLSAIEQGLRAIQALVLNFPEPSISKSLGSSTGFISRLAELICPASSVTVQQISASLIGVIPISDWNKRAAAVCAPQLVRMMEMPKPGGMQEAAAEALVSLLGVRLNRKEIGRDEKSLTRLVRMMDVSNEAVCKQYPVAVVSTLLGGSGGGTGVGGGNGCRKRLLAVGAEAALQKLAEMEVPGVKKALHRLHGGSRLKSIFTRTWRE